MTVDPELAARVASLLDDYLAGERDGGDGATIDPVAAPVAIRAGTAMMLVRLVDADPPVIRVFSPLLRKVERSSELLGELNEINSHLCFLRIFWRDDTVYAATELLAASVDAASLTNACDVVADLSDYYDERLLARYGGEIAYDD